MNIRRVGIIGLGEMGLGMASNLVSKGYELITCAHVRRDGIEALKKMGANEVKTPAEVARAGEVIISIVRDSAQTDAVMFGEEGILNGLKGGRSVALCSTLSPSYCQRLAAKVQQAGGRVLDAPVSGTRAGAEAGTLTFMVGGDVDLFQECMPVFQAMGKNIFHAGGVGMGQAAKLVNNIMLYINLAAASEAMTLGLKAGLDLDKMRDIVKVSTGNNWVVQNYEQMRRARESPRTRELHYNTMDLAMAYARELGAFSLPVIGLLSQSDPSALSLP